MADNEVFEDDWEKLMVSLYREDPELALMSLEREFNEYKKTKDPTYFMIELGKVSKAYGISKLREESKLSRRTLYNTFTCKHKPSFEHLASILSTLGLDFKLTKKVC